MKTPYQRDFIDPYQGDLTKDKTYIKLLHLVTMCDLNNDVYRGLIGSDDEGNAIRSSVHLFPRYQLVYYYEPLEDQYDHKIDFILNGKYRTMEVIPNHRYFTLEININSKGAELLLVALDNDDFDNQLVYYKETNIDIIIKKLRYLWYGEEISAILADNI